MLLKIQQLDEDSQITRPTQAEEDQYEMNVRASNIVNMIFTIYIKLTKLIHVMLS